LNATFSANPVVSAGTVKFGNNLPISIIAGPCQLESRSHALEVASALKEIAARLKIGLVYKTSFDKANRSSGFAARGIGLAQSLRSSPNTLIACERPCLTDHPRVHPMRRSGTGGGRVADPRPICAGRPDLLAGGGGDRQGVTSKKGHFLAAVGHGQCRRQITGGGNRNVLWWNRTRRVLGYNTLVSDMRALPIMARTGAPVIFDGDPSVQQPGGQGTSSAANPSSCRCWRAPAVAVGVAGVFHRNPSRPR